MAALRPCPSGLVVGASQLRLGTLSPRIVQPFGRRGSNSLLGLKTSTDKTGHQLRHHHAIGAQKGAEEGPFGQDPDDKKRRIEEQVKMFRGIFRDHLDLENVGIFTDHLGLEKDLPFREDIEKIGEYEKAMSSWNTSIFYIEATTFARYLCMIAAKGVKLASRVVDSAALRPDKQGEICACTAKQTLVMYVSIFVKLVKDARDKKFNDESVFSLLGAFRGVATVGHILLQDALANVNYVGYSNSLVKDADDTWCKFKQEMNNLEEKFRAVSKSAKAYQILRATISDAMILTMLFVSAVVGRHERVLGYAPGIKPRRSIRASNDGQSDASETSSGST